MEHISPWIISLPRYWGFLEFIRYRVLFLNKSIINLVSNQLWKILQGVQLVTCCDSLRKLSYIIIYFRIKFYSCIYRT